MSKTLHERFKDFLDTFAGVENIDALNMNQTQSDSEKADYFAENRQLIIELKSLETDTEQKVAEILEPHRSRPEFPLFVGVWEVNKVLKHLPDGRAINNKIVDAVTSSVKKCHKKASGQIGATKSTFNLPGAQGLLILLNEKIDVLSPEFIMYKLRERSNKKNPDGSHQFPEINCVLLITEAHYAPAPNNLIGLLMLNQPIETVSEFKYSDFIERLTRKWTEFNNLPLYDGGKIKSIKDLNPQSVAGYNKSQEKLIPRHEYWRRCYRRNSYFRSYDEKSLVWMFEMIMSELVPGMLKGATKEEKGKVIFWIEVFTHFIEEINHRGMDMKVFSSLLVRLGESVEEQMKKRFPDLEASDESWN